MARLVPAACNDAGREDRHVHAVQAVQELVQKPTIHPLRQPEGGKACLPQADRPLVRRLQMGDCRRRVAEPGTPCLSGTLPLRAVPKDVDFVLVRRAVVGARGVGPPCPGATPLPLSTRLRP